MNLYGFVYLFIGVIVICLVVKPKKITLSFFKNIVSVNNFYAYVGNVKKRKNHLYYNKKYNNCNNQKEIMRKNNCAEKINYRYLRIAPFNVLHQELERIALNSEPNFAVKFLKDNKKSLCSGLDYLKALSDYKYVKYRAKNGECLVQTLANSISYKIICEDKFNAISCFNNVKSQIKLYKKEENAFYLLLLQSLFVWLVVLLNECKAFERQIKMGANAKQYSSFKGFKNVDFALYGCLVFNDNARALTQNFSCYELTCAVQSTLQYFEELKEKFKIILNWINFLQEKGFVQNRN